MRNTRTASLAISFALLPDFTLKATSLCLTKDPSPQSSPSLQNRRLPCLLLCPLQCDLIQLLDLQSHWTPLPAPSCAKSMTPPWQYAPPVPEPPKVTVDFYPASNEAIPVEDSSAVDSSLDNIAVPTWTSSQSTTQQSGFISSDDSLSASTQTPGSESDEDRDTTLGGILRQCAVPHADGGDKCFWPSQLLKGILTVQRIKLELDEYACTIPTLYQRDTNLHLAETIEREHLVIFALLCLVSKGVCIRQCIHEKLKDKHLPLRIDRRDGCKLYRPETDQPIRFFQKPLMNLIYWLPHEREYFARYQERFNPVVFGWDHNGRAQQRDFTTEVVLPFVQSQSSRETQQGGFATVDQVEVHPYCHSFHDILPSVGRIQNQEQDTTLTDESDPNQESLCYEETQHIPQ